MITEGFLWGIGWALGVVVIIIITEIIIKLTEWLG